MRWDKEAEADLRKYPGMLNAVQNLEERVAFLTASSECLKGPVLDDVPIHGGGSHYEDRILDNLVEREKKKALLEVNRQQIRAIERGLSALNKDERDVLEGFYIHPSKGCVDSLIARLHCERATVYRIRTRALYNFTVNMYGLLDL